MLVVALLVTACGGSSNSSGNSTNLDAKASYQALIGAGTDLLRTGKTQPAGQLFQAAIVKDPRDVVGHYDLGVVYQDDGELRDALLQYQQALVDDPHYAPAMFNEAILISRHNVPLAIFYYGQVIHMQPDSPTAFLNLGLLRSQHRATLQVGLFDLKQAVRLDPALRGQIPEPLRSEFAAARPPRLPHIRPHDTP
jgi:Tfp pilus assembly protein PilF